MARFKTGLVVGFAAGYVLGSRAGRERYEQIRRGWGRLRTSAGVQRASEKAGHAITVGIERGKTAAADGFDRVRVRVRERKPAGF